MTDYLERGELLERLSARHDSASSALRDALVDDPSIELVPVTQTDPDGMLPTYRVRLERSLEEAGPPTLGLAEWVDALEHRVASRLAVVRAGSITGLCLLDDDGNVRAVTTVEAST